ncbi:MAG: aminodeoxychorismate/anthranilate synthase component II [Candidatus Omnitrophica bacterium]|nr:aminodeoxychorismate/anthranilate synthase component II [Candidatus Omnitrophota bacterium]
MILVIDNYDSFTYNLVQYLGELGEDLKVFRNDKVKLGQIEKFAPECIVISPGPGSPKDAGISKSVIEEFGPSIPILGVCLGLQCIGEVYGAKIVRCDRIMHGKVSSVFHDGRDIFKGIPSPFIATRYHSLVIDPGTLKDPLELIAWTEDNEIMGVRHKNNPTWGVQFHPESILTQEGMNILKNFLKLAKK